MLRVDPHLVAVRPVYDGALDAVLPTASGSPVASEANVSGARRASVIATRDPCAPERYRRVQRGAVSTEVTRSALPRTHAGCGWASAMCAAEQVRFSHGVRDGLKRHDNGVGQPSMHGDGRAMCMPARRPRIRPHRENGDGRNVMGRTLKHAPSPLRAVRRRCGLAESMRA